VKAHQEESLFSIASLFFSPSFLSFGRQKSAGSTITQLIPLLVALSVLGAGLAHGQIIAARNDRFEFYAQSLLGDHDCHT
jgi:hypothetical protein